MEKQYIGIILGPKLYQVIARGEKAHALSFYEEAGRENHIIPCYLQLEDLKPGDEQIEVWVMNPNGKFTKTLVTKPMVYHNRGYQSTKAERAKINQLKEEGIIIFNEWNRFGKYKIHEMLMKNEIIKPHLPDTVMFNEENLIKMLENHRELIIKPNKGTLGKRNIKALKVSETEGVVHYPRGSEWFEEVIPLKQIPEKLTTICSSKYLIQERIALAEIAKNPFDLRVSVQRNYHGDWQVIGMVGKVAKTGSFVTNVARGGSCYPLHEIITHLPHLDYNQVYREIESLSLNISEELGHNIPNLADLGLDIGITFEGFPMFIECNARDLRVTFRNAGLFNVWKDTHMTPIGYGKYLLDNLKEQ